MTKVKICGLTNLEDAVAAIEVGADFLGFIFAPSPRRLDPERASGFWGRLPPGVPRVAVFRDQTVEEVERVLSLVSPDYLQFHGAERPGFCRLFDKPVIRAVSASDPLGLAAAEAYAEIADYFIVDLPKEERTGTLSASVARAAMRLPKPAFLAGGLAPENVGRIVAEAHPFGVDVARGVESSPGKKDREKMRAFVENAKQAPGTPRPQGERAG
jgi:phosphoribosylanthranilate isomerase